jgi:RNA polymerase sigma factor (sigma-70 family)
MIQIMVICDTFFPRTDFMISIFALLIFVQKKDNIKILNQMENSLQESGKIICAAYERYRPAVLGYFHKRLLNEFEAEDLTQDVFLKLLNYEKLLRQDTVQHFIFTIARNLSIDYNRRFFKRIEITQDVMENMELFSNTTENTVAYNELLLIEGMAINKLPEQRGKVYRLSMHGNFSYKEMAEQLKLSPRTIEKHLLLGRSHIREYVAACI